eukprot:3831484-Rhodomonas_salina.1
MTKTLPPCPTVPCSALCRPPLPPHPPPHRSRCAGTGAIESKPLLLAHTWSWFWPLESTRPMSLEQKKRM